MLIEVQCPNGHLLHVKDKHAGKMGACPRCAAPVKVPFLPASHVADAAHERLSVGPVRPRPDDDPSRDVLLNDRAQTASGQSSSGLSSSGLSSSSLSSSSLAMLAAKGKLCLECGKVLSQSFTICPRCGTPLAVYRHLDISKEDDVVVVHFNKRQIVDEALVREITDELNSVIDRGHSYNLDLSFSKVVAVSSLMLGKLVMLHRKMQLKSRQLKLRNVGPEVREVLAVTKLDRLLDVHEQ